MASPIRETPFQCSYSATDQGLFAINKNIGSGAGETHSQERRVLGFGVEVILSHSDLSAGIDDGEGGLAAYFDFHWIQTKDLAGLHRAGLNQTAPGKKAAVHKIGYQQRHSGLEADGAKVGDLKLTVLLMGCVRSMIGHHTIDGAIDETVDKGLHVVAGAQRWVHLEVGVVRVGDVFLGEEEMMRGDLAGHRQAVSLCLAHEIQGARRGDVSHMQRAPSETAKLDIADDLDLLAQRRPTEHTQAGACTAFVDDAVGSQGLVFAVGDDRTVKLAHILHAGAHHAGRLHAMAVVRETACALHGHVADFCQRFALLAVGERADGVDAGKTELNATVDLIAHAGARIGDGVGVGHGGHVGIAAMGSSSDAGLNVLFVLEARIAEMHVHIHKARHKHLAGTVDDLNAVRSLDHIVERRDSRAIDEHVFNGIQAHLGIYYACALKQYHCLLLPKAGTWRPCGCTHRR